MKMNQEYKTEKRVAVAVLLTLGLLSSPLKAQVKPSPGSLFTATGRLADPIRDLRAGAVGDVITIVVSDSASAIATGGTNTQRNSSGTNEIGALIGTLSGTNPLANLLDFSNDRALQGQGSTSRDLVLTTTLSARVIAFTLSGLMVVEGTKEITVNSERQTVTLRGLVRPVDVSPSNTILSNQVSDLKVAVNGKGVVDDAIKRPFSLYRLFMGFLPF